MARRVILAVAGAGKTRHLCQSLDRDKKNLVLAFTHENIKNLRRELRVVFGECPRRTDVLTFDSFVYRFAILPYMPAILGNFPDAGFRPDGITMEGPPPRQVVCGSRAGYRRNPAYINKNNLRHYVDEHNRFYCETLPELVMGVGNGKKALIKKVAAGINRCYDAVAVDEFQDFREYESDFVLALAKELDDVTLIGDFYQHSVAAMKRSGRPFERGKARVSYEQFVEQMRKNGFDVDTSSLVKSWRCSPDVCRFVSNKLGIPIESRGETKGVVRFIDDRELEEVLTDENIVKLVYNGAKNEAFKPCFNWSYSKGDTYEKVCVILTGKESMALAAKGGNRSYTREDTTRNVLYVALTRTRGDLLLVSKSQIDSWKAKHALRV